MTNIYFSIHTWKKKHLKNKIGHQFFDELY